MIFGVRVSKNMYRLGQPKTAVNNGFSVAEMNRPKAII